MEKSRKLNVVVVFVVGMYWSLKSHTTHTQPLSLGKKKNKPKKTKK